MKGISKPPPRPKNFLKKKKTGGGVLVFLYIIHPFVLPRTSELAASRVGRAFSSADYGPFCRFCRRCRRGSEQKCYDWRRKTLSLRYSFRVHCFSPSRDHAFVQIVD